MSEMFRPAPPPAAPDHERHDPLLVAQLAAGDPLDPARRQEAQRWLETCAACTRLAADLRAVSAAVAAEPVPPRRRDFRLTHEQAESLQGNAVARALRRLSAPRARGLTPAAAGILSLGLVFMVAGYAWPDGGTIRVGSEVAPLPAAVERSGETATESVAPPEGAQPLAQVAPAAELGSPPVGEEAPVSVDDATNYFASEPEALEGLAEHQAGTSARNKATVEEAESADALELADRGPVPDASMAAAAALDVSATDEDTSAIAQDTSAIAQDTSAAAPDRLAVDAAEGLEAESGAALSAAVDGGEGDEAGAMMGSLEDDAGLGSWLVLVGVVLATSGGALLLLGWLSRRSRDPLLDG